MQIPRCILFLSVRVRVRIRVKVRVRVRVRVTVTVRFRFRVRVSVYFVGIAAQRHNDTLPRKAGTQKQLHTFSPCIGVVLIFQGINRVPITVPMITRPHIMMTARVLPCPNALQGRHKSWATRRSGRKKR